jgi:hypothetical protein
MGFFKVLSRPVAGAVVLLYRTGTAERKVGERG